jgi:hypothetical protein
VVSGSRVAVVAEELALEPHDVALVADLATMTRPGWSRIRSEARS